MARTASEGLLSETKTATNGSTADHLAPVMLFSGKGGVGKTTLAAATAVKLAQEGSRVLILSTDPAHNLSDVLALRLYSRPTPVLPNMEAMEVDAQGMFGEALDMMQSGGFKSLIKVASETPGIDEFGAIETLLQVLEQAAHDVVIVDTAPTGHTLRLLMVPELLDGWLGTLLSLRHKLARAGRLLKKLWPTAATQTPDAGDLEAGLSDSRQRIQQLRDQLTDPQQAQIILVSIPEAMSVMETTRTVQMLSGHGMPVGTVVVNQLQPQNQDCPHCIRRRQLHLAELAHLKQRLPQTIPLRIVESQTWPIAGTDALGRFAELIWKPQAED